MLSFVIPLRAKCITKDWGLTSSLIENTLQSAIAQECSVSIFICGHDRPEIDIINESNVHFLEMPFSPPSQFTPPQFIRDRHRKKLHGSVEARDRGADFLMFLDADDLVSNRLGTFLLDHQNKPSFYYAADGYELDMASGRLRRRDSLHLLSSSTYIFPTEHVEIPKDTQQASLNSFQALHHQNYIPELSKEGLTPIPIPFPSVIWKTGHAQNTSSRFTKGKLLPTLRRKTSFQLQGSPPSPSIKSEFGIT